MKQRILFILVLLTTFLIDQGTKNWVVDRAYEIHKTMGNDTVTESELVGTTLIEGKYIDIELQLNKGVAFSMFAFLGAYMKWIQGLLVILLLFIIIKENYLESYAIPAGLIIGGALGNVYDRFNHEGVVDFIFWHYGFLYPVFNYADIAIDIAFIFILFIYFRMPKRTVQ